MLGTYKLFSTALWVGTQCRILARLRCHHSSGLLVSSSAAYTGCPALRSPKSARTTPGSTTSFRSSRRNARRAGAKKLADRCPGACSRRWPRPPSSSGCHSSAVSRVRLRITSPAASSQPTSGPLAAGSEPATLFFMWHRQARPQGKWMQMGMMSSS